MSAVRLWARLLRATGPRATDVLSAIAFAFATAALLAVLGGVNAFRLRLETDEARAFSYADRLIFVPLASASSCLESRRPSGIVNCARTRDWPGLISSRSASMAGIWVRIR